MEKRVLIAALLSAVFLALYSKVLSIWYPNPPALQPQSQQQEAHERPEHAIEAAELLVHHIEDEEVTSIKSEAIELEIGNSSGAIRRMTLTRFMDKAGHHPLSIASGLPLLHLQVDSGPLSWRKIKASPTSATFEASDSQENSYHITYAADIHNPLIIIELTQLDGGHSSEDLVVTSSWTRVDELDSRRNPLEINMLVKNGNGKPKHLRYFGPLKQAKSVPRGTLLVSLAERYFCQSIRHEGAEASVRLLPSPDGTIAVESRIRLKWVSDTGPRQRLLIYAGARDYFRLKAAGFSDAFPVGMIGQIGLILLSFLKLIAGLTRNYGVAIVVFSVLIGCATAPFTLLSYKSMRKMQELKPQVDRLMAQHKSDPTRANKEVFALYKEHRVSPLSGCLPMLLQMPILIALFRAISHFIELRGQPFLWIKDLSSPDRLAQLPFSIPFIGSELNVLPVIMSAVMYFQSRMSQGRMPQDQSNPTMKIMSGPMMSVIFGVMFYQFPSGLVLYWLTSSLTSLAWSRVVT